VIFMTLEDETGVANAIVWPKVFEKYRSVAMGARLVKIRGRLQSQSGVIHVVADHLEDLTSTLGILQREAKRFGGIQRADEVLHPTADHREKKLVIQMERAAREKAITNAAAADGRSEATETASVMPRGRNFH
jgi:DNA polymerase III alpha subunit